jgi:hypothetical protein
MRESSAKERRCGPMMISPLVKGSAPTPEDDTKGVEIVV